MHEHGYSGRVDRPRAPLLPAAHFTFGLSTRVGFREAQVVGRGCGREAGREGCRGSRSPPGQRRCVPRATGSIRGGWGWRNVSGIESNGGGGFGEANAGRTVFRERDVPGLLGSPQLQEQGWFRGLAVRLPGFFSRQHHSPSLRPQGSPHAVPGLPPPRLSGLEVLWGRDPTCSAWCGKRSGCYRNTPRKGASARQRAGNGAAFTPKLLPSSSATPGKTPACGNQNFPCKRASFDAAGFWVPEWDFRSEPGTCLCPGIANSPVIRAWRCWEPRCHSLLRLRQMSLSQARTLTTRPWGQCVIITQSGTAPTQQLERGTLTLAWWNPKLGCAGEIFSFPLKIQA
nr:uncharacterized protein LOC116827725 [Chelonoidis abingdonii]